MVPNIGFQNSKNEICVIRQHIDGRVSSSLIPLAISKQLHLIKLILAGNFTSDLIDQLFQGRSQNGTGQILDFRN